MTEMDLYYHCSPREFQNVGLPVEFLSVQAFLADEAACKGFWELVSTQFRTRSKFLTVWQHVRHVAICRDTEGAIEGFLIVSTPINWQIDYVVVRPEARGRGVASALVKATLNEAVARKVPYVMLTSRESLRQLYESCGFVVLSGTAELVA